MDRERPDTVEKMHIVKQLTQTLVKTEELFGDLEPLVSKNLTSTGFWFIIDAFNFLRVSEVSLMKTYDSAIKNYDVDIQDFSQTQEHQFILKVRKLISRQKGTLNMSDILSTPIDEAIQAAEQQCSRIAYKNTKNIEILKKQIGRQNNELEIILGKMNKQPHDTHPMFVYEELEESVCQEWTKQEKNKQKLEKCYICSKPNKLISCKSCHLKVHDDCYPTLVKEYSKQKKNEDKIKKQIKQFQCENCQNQIDSQNEVCCLCCCVGGIFMKTCLFDTDIIVNLETVDQSQPPNLNPKITTHIDFNLRKKNEKKTKYVHVSCFIWNTECKWNPNIRLVQGINTIDKKKKNAMCSLCGIAFGASVPCSNQSCRRFYHAECARRKRLQMNLIRAKTSVIELFCERHRHLSRNESIHQKNSSKMRDIRKLIDGMDKQIKRQHSNSSNFLQLKSTPLQKQVCLVCGREQGVEKVSICKQCRKWYHNACSNYCKNCLL